MRKTIGILLFYILTTLVPAGELKSSHDSGHAEYWWSAVPAFFALFGFLGCLLLIAVAKGLGKLFVEKKEDYYDVC